MYTKMSKCCIEVGDSLNRIDSVYPNLLHCTRTQCKGNRIIQRHDSHDSGLFCCSCSSADKEQHSKIFFGIIKCALHGSGGQLYCISGLDIMRISYNLFNISWHWQLVDWTMLIHRIHSGIICNFLDKLAQHNHIIQVLLFFFTVKRHFFKQGFLNLRSFRHVLPVNIKEACYILLCEVISCNIFIIGCLPLFFDKFFKLFSELSSFSAIKLFSLMDKVFIGFRLTPDLLC